MKSISEFMDWTYRFYAKHGERPENVPLTPTEIHTLIQDAQCLYMMNYAIPIASPPRICDFSLEQTDFAESLRSRRLEMPLTRISETARFEPYLDSLQQKDLINGIFRALEAKICSDQTMLELTFPDPWGNLKRRLHVTKWFPVKPIKRKVLATVLYPYIKVSLPHNRHTVHFRDETVAV